LIFNNVFIETMILTQPEWIYFGRGVSEGFKGSGVSKLTDLILIINIGFNKSLNARE